MRDILRDLYRARSLLRRRVGEPQAFPRLRRYASRQSSHDFATNDANLDARLARPVGDNGGKSRLNEIHIIDASIAALKGGDGPEDQLAAGEAPANPNRLAIAATKYGSVTRGHSLTRLSANYKVDGLFDVGQDDPKPSIKSPEGRGKLNDRLI